MQNFDGNPKEQPCQPKESPVLLKYITKTYILFEIGFTVFSNAHHGSSICSPFQPEEIPILPDSLTPIYIIFEIGFTVISNGNNASLKCLPAINLNASLNLALLVV